VLVPNTHDLTQRNTRKNF